MMKYRITYNILTGLDSGAGLLGFSALGFCGRMGEKS